ncbi:hypothetical protein GIB67_002515 [Kingdonia uniflora]|uniref:Uncharacterized protein n=1 Tax=Kingdonia uniflora TaxID=39325 RepID=A0A7J7N929_9MAGN|nr:hypothetical protein GIB67_002515 [Kingdonia uniflora]
MPLSMSKVSGTPMVTNRANLTEPCGKIHCFGKSTKRTGLHLITGRVEFQRPYCGGFLTAKLNFNCGKPCICVVNREHTVLCQYRGTRSTEAKECVTHSKDFPEPSRAQIGDDEAEELYESVLSEGESTLSSQGLADICKFMYNDAKFVNERAHNDIILLSRGIMKLNDRACQDFAILGTEFLKIDARAREDTEKIDNGVKKKAERLHHIATVFISISALLMILKDKAQSKLRSAADKHWNDGALEADLRRADSLAKRRAMEDAFMALEFVKNVHDMMVSEMYKLPLRRKQGSVSIEKNGKNVDFFPGELSTERIAAIQDAYFSMASALSEADGIDYTDPEEVWPWWINYLAQIRPLVTIFYVSANVPLFFYLEQLELLVATLIDLDAMDGKSSVSLLAECSSSPDVSTRQALANALAAAPSMWILGNAGMGALQRLAEDSNPAIAAAASKTISELKKQWEIEEGDSWRFTMNRKLAKEIDDIEKNYEDTETK